MARLAAPDTLRLNRALHTTLLRTRKELAWHLAGSPGISLYYEAEAEAPLRGAGPGSLAFIGSRIPGQGSAWSPASGWSEAAIAGLRSAL